MLERRWGRIVKHLVSGRADAVAERSRTCASKGRVADATKSMALDLSPTARYGECDLSGADRHRDDARAVRGPDRNACRAVLPSSRVGFFGEPSDIAAGAVWTWLSDDARFVTG